MTLPKVILSRPAAAALDALCLGDGPLAVDDVRDALTGGAIMPGETPPLFREILEKISDIEGRAEFACEARQGTSKRLEDFVVTADPMPIEAEEELE
jgi:hypothetical protein